MEYNQISVGSSYCFERKIVKDEVLQFAKLTGDENPLHIDEEFGKKSIFKKNVVHGMLAGSLFSRIVGMICPGENSLYLQQTLQFRKPVFYDDLILVRATIINKNDSLMIITMKMEILRENELLINGEAKVKVL